ncbi:MAG: hypothetical protein HN576_06915, partial [Bacteriovoracaceae bacterium]|nr:hypothetical protein [Bacteriovoracaceae bacterium]
NKTTAESEVCLSTLKSETIYDIASGTLCDPTVPDAISCVAEGKIWNCNINFCLPKSYNDKLTTSTVLCYEKPVQSETDMCMEQVKSDTISDIAGGALCEKNTPQSLDCTNSGNIWNCLINYCLTPEYNASLTNNIIDCYKKPTSTERDQCIADLKDQTIEDIAGGALCDKTSREATQCEAKPGYVYNCEVKFCLPKDYNDNLAQNAKICFDKPTDEEKQKCMTDLKKVTALEIASGKLCDATVPEAIACAAEDKIWNCNVNFCLDKQYNDDLSQNAALCYEKNIESEIDKCMTDLKLTIVADIAGGGQCDPQVKEAIDCKAEDKIWNCTVDLCIDKVFNQKIIDGSVNCYKLENRDLIDKCMVDLKSTLVAEVASGALCDPDTPDAVACFEEGKIYNCQVKLCLPKDYNEALTQKIVACYQKPTKPETDTCIAEVKSDTVTDLAKGALCDMNLPEAKECKESGKVWNCNVNFCLSKKYNDQLAEKAVSCYEMEMEAEIDSCMNKLKDETITDIASGSLCDMSSNTSKECTAEGNVYNCNINYCLSPEYNEKLTDKVVACYKETNQQAVDGCMSNVKDETIADLAGGAGCNKNTPEAISCEEKTGKVFNCEINYCVTNEYNQKLIDGTKNCLAMSTAEEEVCLAKLKDNTVKEIASGVLCENTSEEAKECEAGGMVFNCNVNYCLTSEYNNALAGKAAVCYDKATKPEVNACMKKLEHDTAVEIAGGALCKNESEEAKLCEAEGKVYNCTVEYCLTKDQNNQLAEEVAKCQTMPDQEQKEKCMAELEEKATEFVASGGLCDQNTPEAKSCSAKGKVYNCNIGLCISQAENEVLTEEALRCQNMLTDEEKDSCIKELKQVGAAYLATNCDTEGNSEANQCKASGKIWNCHANKCLTEKENEMLTRAILRCEGKESTEEKNACYEDMKEFEKLAADQEGAVNIKDLQYNQKSSMGTAQALTIAIGSLIAAAVAGCISAALFAVAVLMTPNLEEQIKDEAKTKMEQLKKEYAELEAKKGREGVSYEIQVEAFKFYLKALNTAASIADKAGGNMSVLMGLFGAAMAMGAVDIAIGMSSCPACNWPQIACGGIVIGLAGMGMNATSKYKGIAENMANEYRNRAKIIQNLLDRFKKLFGPDGGLDDIIAKADDLKDRVDKKSNTTGNADSDSLGFQSGGKLGGSSSTSFSNDSSGPGIVSNGNGPLNGDKSDPSGGERTCLDNKGKVDRDCKCQKSSSCKQFKMPLLNSQANNVKEDLDIDGALKEVNDIASGKITSSFLDKSVLNKRNSKIRKIGTQLVENANKLLIKNGKRPIDISDAALVKYINARVTKADLAKGAAAFSSGYFGVSQDKLNNKDGIVNKTMNKSKSIPQVGNLLPLTSMRIIPKGIRFDNGEDDPADEVLAMNSLKNTQMEYDYEHSQIISKPEVNIFTIISNRYLNVRREKRLNTK